MQARRRRLIPGALLAWIVAALLAGAATADTLVPLRPQSEGVPWPTAAWPEGPLPPGLDAAAFEQAVEALFESIGRGGVPDTRAVLFVVDGRLVYQRYANGFGPESLFQSWSMAKGITNAFVGLLVADGRLALDDPAPVAAWQTPGDPRREISLRHLLQMRSGLDNADGFGSGDMTYAFISRLLFGVGSRSPAVYAAEVPLAHPVGEHWAYSTGSSVVLADIAGRQVGSSAEQTRDFLRQRLFDPLGMKSAQPEFAASGVFWGGAFVHATAPDWARLGYLYLRDGVWEGRRLLPPGWVDFSRTASPTANNGVHGAHFWVNREPAEGQWVQLPGVPDSAFTAEGAGFQMVAMVPTKDLVAVRLGVEQQFDHELRRRFARVIALFPEAPVREGDSLGPVSGDAEAREAGS